MTSINPLWMDMNVPHLDQYFGVWAILEDTFRAAVERVNRMDLRAHTEGWRLQAGGLRTPDLQPPASSLQSEDGIAVIDLAGTLMKFVGSLADGTSTVLTRRLVRAAADEKKVKAILLRIDSPGGTVSGTNDLAADVAAAAARKPLYAYIEDMGASAAYWIAAAASKVYAGPTAMVGSIGTYAVIEDYSAEAAQAGVKVHVIRAGKFKGAGVPGTEITGEQLAEWQRLVDTLNEHFLQGVATGRRMPLARVRDLADGRVHIGTAARDLGLVDGIQTFDETLESLATSVSRNRSRGGGATAISQEQQAMNKETAQQAADPRLEIGDRRLAESVPPASITELKASFPDSDAVFRESCIEQALSIEQSAELWMDHLRLRLERREKEVDDLKAGASAPGVEPLGGAGGTARRAVAHGGGGGDDGDPLEGFDELVREKMKSGMERRKAILAVARADPELHQAYLAALPRRKV